MTTDLDEAERLASLEEDAASAAVRALVRHLRNHQPPPAQETADCPHGLPPTVLCVHCALAKGQEDAPTPTTEGAHGKTDQGDDAKGVPGGSGTSQPTEETRPSPGGEVKAAPLRFEERVSHHQGCGTERSNPCDCDPIRIMNEVSPGKAPPAPAPEAPKCPTCGRTGTIVSIVCTYCSGLSAKPAASEPCAPSVSGASLTESSSPLPENGGERKVGTFGDSAPLARGRFSLPDGKASEPEAERGFFSLPSEKELKAMYDAALNQSYIERNEHFNVAEQRGRRALFNAGREFERSRAASQPASALTVEEVAALGEAVALFTHEYPQSESSLLCEVAFCKLNARAGVEADVANSAATAAQASSQRSGDGGDGAQRLYEHVASAMGWTVPWGDAADRARQMFQEAYRFAHDEGARDGQVDRLRRELQSVLRDEAELESEREKNEERIRELEQDMNRLRSQRDELAQAFRDGTPHVLGDVQHARDSLLEANAALKRARTADDLRIRELEQENAELKAMLVSVHKAIGDRASHGAIGDARCVDEWISEAKQALEEFREEVAELKAAKGDAERDLRIATDGWNEAEKKLEAWEPTVRYAIEQTETNFFFEGARIRHCSEKFWPAVKAIPEEHRPGSGGKGETA